MNYYVLDASGNQYGPADFPILKQWVQEGRILASTMLKDATSGLSVPASSIPGLFPSPYGSPDPQAPPGPYGPSNPYSQSAAPVPGYAYYPRPNTIGANDMTIAWVLAGVAIFCSLCICAPIGLGFGIAGVIFSRRAQQTGDSRAIGPLVLSWVAIAIGAVQTAMAVMALMSAGGGGFGQ